MLVFNELMPRGPRLDVPGSLHHVMVRGIERRDIFSSDEDREDLLRRLEALVAADGSLKQREKGRGEGPGRIRVAPENRDKFMERLQTRVGRIFSVAPVELRGGSRRRVAVVARAAVGWVAVRVCGLPTSDVARLMGVSASSILRLQERGREALDERGIDAEQLARKCK